MCPLPVEYRPRFADAELRFMLEAAGAVLVEGPRACGKTATARAAAASSVNLDSDTAARAAGLVQPSVLLDGARPRLIDEWQLVPDVWNQVRRAVDDSGGQTGSFILTGSAVPPDDVTRHSGAGRILRMRMRPMSLAELGVSTGEVSLERLFEGDTARATESSLDLVGVANLVATGGWPGLRDRRVDDVLATLRGYVADVARVDLPRVDGVQRDPLRVMRVIQSLARYTASHASARRIAADVGGEDGPIKPHTVLDYLDALRRVFVLEDLPAWAPAMRSRSRLRDAPKRHFVDPSLAVAALGARPERLAREVDTLGLLFESLVVRDLRVYAQAIDADLFHYHDNTGLEADAVVQKRDGAWGAVEVKLGLADIEPAASALLRLADKVDVARHGRNAFLAVVTGWGYAYRRPDGVSVIPIGSLAP
jgi:uncharacterized protein